MLVIQLCKMLHAHVKRVCMMFEVQVSGTATTVCMLWFVTEPCLLVRLRLPLLTNTAYTGLEQLGCADARWCLAL